MDDDGGAIGVIACDVGVYVGVEGVREIRCMWYFLRTKDVGLLLYVIGYDCLRLVDVFCSIMGGKLCLRVDDGFTGVCGGVL